MYNYICNSFVGNIFVSIEGNIMKQVQSKAVPNSTKLNQQLQMQKNYHNELSFKSFLSYYFPDDF